LNNTTNQNNTIRKTILHFQQNETMWHLPVFAAPVFGQDVQPPGDTGLTRVPFDHELSTVVSHE